MRTLHVTLVVMALVTLSAALVMHLSITSPSLFTDGAYRAPSSMDLYVNGILVENDVDLPMTISIEEGDVVRLEGQVDDFDAGRRAFMLTTDASIFRVYADGRLVASNGYDDLTDFFRMHHGSPQMNIGFFPQDMDVDEIAIEYECIAPARSRQINIDSLVLGSSWDIISLFGNTIRLFACLLVIHATILVVILAIVATHWKTASSGILLILAFEALMIAQTVIGMGVRDLFQSNELLWQILDQVAASPYTILFLAMTRRIDHVACLSSTRHRLLSVLPMAMPALSALAYPVSAQASHFLFHLTKGANLVVCLAYTIAIALEREEASRHLITFSLMMDAAFMLELVNVPGFSTFNALHCLSNVIRIVAVMTYITFTISHYLTSEKIVIGQLGLDDMLYRDSLTGCYTRRNLDEFIHDDEAIRGRRLHILFYDLDGLKLINDSFGHAEGDRLFIHLGDVIHDTFTEAMPSYRFGGDEFVTMVPCDASTGDVEDLALSFARAFGNDAPYSASLSIGWSTYEGGGIEEFDRCLQEADRRMYEMKREHRRKRI